MKPFCSKYLKEFFGVIGENSLICYLLNFLNFPTTMHWCRLGYLIICILLVTLSCEPSATSKVSLSVASSDTLAPKSPVPVAPMPSVPIEVDTFPILTAYKLRMMERYYRRHYGLNRVTLDSPNMVVIHYTVSPTLSSTLPIFQPDRLGANRTYIGKFSPLNVSIHYVVDRDGSIYSLLPDSLMARHIIGFNHVSLGIENVAMDASSLTTEQLVSNIRLVRFLKQRHPTIEYLIGHMEYNDTTLPHYQYFTSLDPDYRAYDKLDPGPDFMQALRDSLATYGLHFAR
ncbi:MAG: peptidoglycan recognition family protein [Bacteroidota bacterium]